MALFTLPQMISRLTRGFVKVTGRMPDGLEKIKIKQEALERIKQQDKVVDMEGNVIDTSKGIMGGKQIKKAMGGRIGYARGTQFELPFGKPDYFTGKGKNRRGIYIQKDGTRLVVPIGPDDLPSYAEGGRIGLKTGMSRRAFLKLMGGVGAGIGALKTGLLKLAGKGAASQAAKEIIKTPAAAGKPEWFDALVTKVINQGEDVTKQFATKDREVVHLAKIDDDATVTVYRDLDTGTVRVDVSDATRNVADDQGEAIVSMEVRGGQLEEGVKGKTPAEFEAVEADYRNYTTSPDGDYDTEVVDNVVNNTKDLTADLTKLKIYARGDNKPTMKEFVESKKRETKLKQAAEDPADYASDRGPQYDPPDPPDDDFAKGGLAGMLGE